MERQTLKTQCNLIKGKDYIGVGVGAVILDQDQVLLLQRLREPEAGYWGIQGGAVEFGETLNYDRLKNRNAVCIDPTTKPKTPPKITIACNSLFTIPSMAASKSAGEVDLTRSRII